MGQRTATKRLASVSIVGPGNLGTALALTLPDAGFDMQAIGVREGSTARRSASALTRKLKAQLITIGRESFDSDVVWITVPDDAIARVARDLAKSQSWKRKVVFHSSGALASDELASLRAKGAKVASVHPMMTFVRGSIPQMQGVAFALEGDAAAVRCAKTFVERLGGNAFVIGKQNKTLYHAFGSFASPMVIALLVSMEQVGKAAGIARGKIKPVMLPLLSQTVNNYLKGDSASAFSGPIVRGDVATVRRHLQELKRIPEAREVYIALARVAVKRLPVKNRRQLEAELQS